MTLKEYAEQIVAAAELFPNAIVIFASDDEGNSFTKVGCSPTFGYFEGDYHGEFIPEDSEDFATFDYIVNCVCLN